MSKRKVVASVRSKDIPKKLFNLIDGVRSRLSVTDIELRIITNGKGSVNIKLEIKACFHPKSTTATSVPHFSTGK